MRNDFTSQTRGLVLNSLSGFGSGVGLWYFSSQYELELILKT